MLDPGRHYRSSMMTGGASGALICEVVVRSGRIVNK